MNRRQRHLVQSQAKDRAVIRWRGRSHPVGDPLYNLANIRKYQNADNAEVKHILTLLGKPGVSTDDRELLCFTLGKIYDDCDPCAVGTASQWQVRQPIYHQAIGCWQRYEKHLAPLKAGLDFHLNPAELRSASCRGI